MSLRKIITVPEPVLRRKAHKVTDFGADLQELIDDMVETMRAAPGVGLAAPQVNVSQRVIVVEFGDEEDEQVPARLYTIVNPEILRPSQETDKGYRGLPLDPRFSGRGRADYQLDGERTEPAWTARSHQGQRLAGAYLPARDRPPGWRLVH